MRAQGNIGRWLGGLLSLVGGGSLLGGLILVMNTRVQRPDEVKSRSVAAVQIEKKKEKKKEPVKQPKPKPQKVRRTRAPRPQLSSNLSGLGAGIPVFDVGGLSDIGNELISDQKLGKDMILNESAVDAPPEPNPGNPSPAYPPRARAKGLEGYVVLRFLVGADGQVKKVSVVESSPEGVFEEAALQAARNWTFKPATYQGQPVSLAVNRRLSFKLT